MAGSSPEASSPKAPVSAAKTERLLNLVIALLYTRAPLTKRQLRSAVAAYGEVASTEAFDRMFERDKDELRELGIPLVTLPVDPGFRDEEGYRIDKRDYALPEIGFEPDELAVLALASRTWEQASLSGSAATALRKLDAAGVQRDDRTLVGLEARVRTVEPAFARVKDALIAHRPIKFSYRGGTGDLSLRHVQPWGVVAWHGRWYVTGFDTDRQAPRVFRLGRIEGAVAWDGKAGTYDVPADHDPRAMVEATGGPASRPAASHPAVVRVRENRCQMLRRSAGSSSPVGDGWDELVIEADALERLADDVVSFGADAVAIAPEGLRDTVIRRLTGAAERNASGGAGEGR